MCQRDVMHSILNVNHCLGITGTPRLHTASEVCASTAHIPFQLKVKQYHVNVTIENGGVGQFQGTG